MDLRTLLVISLLAATPAFAQQGDRSEVDMSAVPPEWEVPPAPVLTAEEALKTFVLQPGFRIELVASEPLLQDPVAMDFDEDGRIWVVEMQSYMPNVDGEGEIAPISRVVTLEDTNGDGRMDKSTVYMENLILPRAVRVVEGGVLVGEPPNLWFTRDTNGDGRADEKTLVSSRYSRQEANPEHGANGLLRGLDNWIHDSMSDEGSFRLIDGEWVVRPTVRRGQWGISHDDYGRHFTNNNVQHLRADLVSFHYYPRNANLQSQAGIFEQVDPDRTVWPIRITPGVNRRVQLREDGRLRTFTAACAPLIYRGDQFPEEYYGNAFVAEPAANLIRRSIIEEDERGFLSGRNAYDEDEFLGSTDERFRPVNLYTAPDGTLYVLDMYRGILQHRQFVTTYLRQQILDRELDKPLGLGRIYRVVHESAKPGPAPRLSTTTAAELVKHLSHANGWWRDTAQRLLVERGNLSVVTALKNIALHHDEELARIHALWTLEGLDALDRDLLVTAMADSSHHIRATALRLAEPFLRETPSREIVTKAIDLASDEDSRVRLQAALSIGELPAANELKERALTAVLQNQSNQPFIIESVLSGLENRELEVLDRLLASVEWKAQKEGYSKALAVLAAAVMREGRPERINQLLTLALTDKETSWQNIALLNGIEASNVTKLSQRPVALDLKPSDPATASRAAKAFAKLEWPKATPEKPKELSPELQLLARKGNEQYQLNCSACHQPGGQGIPGLGERLVDSPWVLGQQENLIRIILHGKEGEQGMMPPMSSLQDENIAAILSHIRRSWGNGADFILPETVTAVRESSNRNQPWTVEELEVLGGDQ